MVNYEYDKEGRTVRILPMQPGTSQGNVIVTRNFMFQVCLATGNRTSPLVECLSSTVLPREHQRVPSHIGLEDCRFFVWNKEAWFMASCPDIDPRPGMNRMVVGPVNDDKIRWVLRSPEPQRCEKNWLPFVSAKGEMLAIVTWDPFVVIRIDPATGEWTEAIRRSPRPWVLDLARGSAAPVQHTDGTWFGVVHEIASDHSGRRHYLHRFFRLSEELEIMHISKAWTLPNRENIEYVSSIVLTRSQVLLGCSQRDSRAFIAKIDLETFLTTYFP